MSRSYRHTPKISICGCQSNKQFKVYSHRRERVFVRTMMAAEQFEIPPTDFGNEWSSPRDGKIWCGEHPQAEYMRK